MTEINEIVNSISDAINICDKYGMFGISDALFEIIREVNPDWDDEREDKSMNIKSGFYTAIIIEVGIFGSEIVDEKHFQTEEDAREFCNTVQDGHITIIASV